MFTSGTGEAAPTPGEAPLAGTPTRGPRSIDIAPDGTMYLILREGNKVFSIDPAQSRCKHIAWTGDRVDCGNGGPTRSGKFCAPRKALDGPKGGVCAADA